MALILCLETATEICSVALSENGNIVALAEETKSNQHASHLTLLIEQVMREKNLSDLDAIAVSKGPGSYTGLRVGVSTAKGFCYGLGTPLIAVPTLQSLSSIALEKISEEKSCCLLPMIDARRMEVYTAVYDEQLNEKQAANALIIEQNVFEDFADKTAYYFGNGANKCQTVLAQNNLHYLPEITCSAKGMAMLAEKIFQQKKFEDVAYFEPYYLKDFVGTTPKNK